MKFKKGDVVFFKSNGIYGWFVQRYNLLKYHKNGPTHVGIIGDIQGTDVIIYEALSNGLVKNAYSSKGLNDLIKKGQVTVKSPIIFVRNVTKVCEKYLGTPYGWFDIFGLTISFITGFKLIEVTGSRKIICSEFVARVLYDISKKKINFQKELKKPYSYITPMDMFISKLLE